MCFQKVLTYRCQNIDPLYRKVCRYPHAIKLLHHIENCARTLMSYTTSYKAPPQLNNETSYERWKKEVALWETFTGLSAEKKSTSNLLSLTRRAQDAVLELDITKLNSVTGVKRIYCKT